MVLFQPARVALERIVPYLSNEDVPHARVTCSDFAAAVDSSTAAYQRIKISTWESAQLHRPVRISTTVGLLQAHIRGSLDWQQLLLFVQQLPQLHVLSWYRPASLACLPAIHFQHSCAPRPACNLARWQCHIACAAVATCTTAQQLRLRRAAAAEGACR